MLFEVLSVRLGRNWFQGIRLQGIYTCSLIQLLAALSKSLQEYSLLSAHIFSADVFQQCFQLLNFIAGFGFDA